MLWSAKDSSISLITAISMNKNDIKRAYKNVIRSQAALNVNLDTLAKIASKAYGEQLFAELYSSGELEFRTFKNGHIDDFSCVRLEDIMKKL